MRAGATRLEGNHLKTHIEYGLNGQIWVGGNHPVKQIVQVFEAVKIGCETSDQVSAVTGLPIGIASAHLSSLARDGLIRRVCKGWRRFNKAGRASHQYAPI